NPQPITPSDAARVAQAQHASMVAAPGGKDAAAPATAPVKTGTPVTAAAPAAKGSSSTAAIGWAVLVVVVLAAAVVTPLVLRRRRQRAEEEAASTAAPGWSDPAEQLG